MQITRSDQMFFRTFHYHIFCIARAGGSM